MANFEDYLTDYNLEENPTEEDTRLQEDEHSEIYPGDNSGDLSDNYQDNYDDDYRDQDYDESHGDNYQFEEVDDGFGSYDDVQNDVSEPEMDEFHFDMDEYKDSDYLQESNKTEKKNAFNLEKLSVTSNGLFTMIGIGVAIIFAFVALIISIGVKNSVKKDVASLQTQISSVAETNNQVLEKLAAIESTINQAAIDATTEVKSNYIVITKQPTSVSTTIDRGSDGMVQVFSVCAKGSGMSLNSFYWQKRSSSGEWVNIDFDGNSRNETLGLQISNDIADGVYTSTLWAVGLKEEAFSTYRCVMIDSAGERSWTDTVEITQK